MSSLGRFARLSAAAAAILLLSSCAPADTGPQRVDRTLPEPPTTEFDPSLIVSDDAFYDSRAMSEEQIQAFLEGVSCRADAGVPCLAEYTETTTTQPAVGGAHCGEYLSLIHI